MGAAAPGPAAPTTEPSVNQYTYNIQASNVQIGSSSTMVSNETPSGRSEDDAADDLERKYNPDDWPSPVPPVVQEPPRDPLDKNNLSHWDAG